MVPSEIALMKIMKDRMKIMSDARPNQLISFLTMCCPIIAAKKATTVKKRAAKGSKIKCQMHGIICVLGVCREERVPYGTGNRSKR
ncbi:Os08g0389733 [Oryza sativa Japonica Group]|jgi:hypothetical protein|uniref:Os08g0389733 protein n=1 Tax=Oryza sativa subsp. japonica TaxID=39947 RepID=C7J6C4_ORYSJ|nr:Os08g0389733 [Oryza sativa Japonica Group]|eukprot:NP_001175555.1 Os08g0389733 [Oryza sativa Japonica Group]